MAEFLPLSRKLILALETTGGYAWVPRHQKLPIQERFYAGGLNSVRGYLEDSLGGPETKNNGVPIGGKVLLINNLEFRYDLYRQLLNGVLFFDAGNVWDSHDNVTLSSIGPVQVPAFGWSHRLARYGWITHGYWAESKEIRTVNFT